MNSMPKNVSAKRTATIISTNTMPRAIMRSLAASLRMSQGMLQCNRAREKMKPRGGATRQGLSRCLPCDYTQYKQGPQTNNSTGSRDKKSPARVA